MGRGGQVLAHFMPNLEASPTRGVNAREGGGQGGEEGGRDKLVHSFYQASHALET